jgi:hypothetical protein
MLMKTNREGNSSVSVASRILLAGPIGMPTIAMDNLLKTMGINNAPIMFMKTKGQNKKDVKNEGSSH